MALAFHFQIANSLSTKYSALSLLFFSLWKDVTFNLKIRDIDAATEAKHRLEERQRVRSSEKGRKRKFNGRQG